jgi:acyl carrier protein
MSELESRLHRCFLSVFPALMPEEIKAASVLSLAEWDSLVSVTLAVVVQEEFGVEIDLLDLPELDSYEAFEAYLRRLTGRGVERNQ